MADLELMMAWRSNPNIHKHFRDQDGPLVWENHVEWFVNRSAKRRDYIIEYNGRRVGAVGIAAEGDVSIYMGEETLTDEGIGTEALTLACERAENRSLWPKFMRITSAAAACSKSVDLNE